MTITSPSGQKYNWEGPNPPTEEDINALKKYEADKGIVAPPASMALRPDQVQSQQANAAQQDQTKMQQVSNAGIPFGMAMGAGPIAGENQQVAGRARGSIVDSGLEAGGATLGQAVGAGTGPMAPVAVPVLGALGGMAGNAAGQGRRMILGEQDKPNWGSLGAAGVSGAIPGMSQAKGLVMPIVKTGAYYGAGNVLAKAAETAINRGERPTNMEAFNAFIGGFPGAVAQKFMGNLVPGALTEQQKLNFVRDSRFRDLRGEGVNVTPHEMGVGSDTISSMGGKAATQQAVSESNVKTWQRMAREDLGLSPEAVGFKEGDKVNGIKSDFDVVREKAYKPYEELAAISSKVDHDLEMLRIQNKGVQDAYQAFKNAKITRDQYEVIKNTRDALESGIQATATSVGRPDLVPEMLASKKRIAMSYAYEDATTQGSGFVRPDVLGDQLANGVPLTDNARRMALYAQAFPKSSVVQGPAPGVNALNPMAAAQAASQGTPSGFLAAGYQMYGSPIARKYMLSSGAQNRYAQIPQDAVESVPSALIRFAAEQKARERK